MRRQMQLLRFWELPAILEVSDLWERKKTQAKPSDLLDGDYISDN